MMRKFLPFAALAATGGCVVDNSYNPAPAAAPSAPDSASRISAADEAAISRTLDAVYGAISGPVGQARDWDAMRALFTDDARLYAVGPNGSLSGGSVDDYIAKSGDLLVTMGFTERELAHRLEVYGDVAHAWSSYRGDFTRNGQPGHVRGINSFQLHRQADGSWKVHSIFWQAEHDGLPLPTDMEAR